MRAARKSYTGRDERGSGVEPGHVWCGEGTCMQDEILTEDLLARLLSAEKPEAYLEEGTTLERTLPDYLFELLADRGMRRSEVVRASGLNPTVVYDTFTGKMVPGRDNAIMLAFGLRCDVRETQRLLRLAGSAELWPKVRRDAIIIWCIKEGKTRSQCDDELWKFGEKTLFGTDRLH